MCVCVCVHKKEMKSDSDSRTQERSCATFLYFKVTTAHALSFHNISDIPYIQCQWEFEASLEC